MSGRHRHYSMFGLSIRSSIELPELPVRPSGHPDVTIEQGDTPWLETRDDLWLDHREDAAVLTVDGVAQFEVDGPGETLLVRPATDVPAKNLRLYLLGSAMGLVLHRRGMLPLHCNAVDMGGEAVAFMGASGAGKSTLAAWFLDHGFRHLADDVSVVVSRPDAAPLLYPGLPRLRLYEAPLKRSGRDPAAFQRSFETDEVEKFDVPVAANSEATPLAALYLLDRGDEVSIEPLGGVEAVEALMANTYRGGFLVHSDERRRHWEQCLALAATVPVARLRRRWNDEHFDEDARAIVELIQSQLKTSA